MKKKAVIDPLNLIVGVLLMVSGVLYILNYGSWAIIVASISLLMEALKKVV